MAEESPQKDLQLTPKFNLVFLTVLGLTILSLGVSIFLSIYPNPSDEDIKGIVGVCLTTYKMGFGAIIGLVGGKAL